jgi:hypothetical protein
MALLNKNTLPAPPRHCIHERNQNKVLKKKNSEKSQFSSLKEKKEVELASYRLPSRGS